MRNKSEYRIQTRQQVEMRYEYESNVLNIDVLYRRRVFSQLLTSHDVTHVTKMAEKQQHGKAPGEEDDTYEILDLTTYACSQQWWSTVFGNNSGPIAEKYSVATQIVMGGVTGWCAGYLFQRLGKVTATAIGGGFLLLQIANHSGYVQINWKKVEKDVNKAKRHLKKKANKAAPEINTFIEEATEFVKKNLVISSGFVGGFFLGLAS